MAYSRNEHAIRLVRKILQLKVEPKIEAAAGITALQVSANPYVVALGCPRTASSRLNLTQAFNSLGTTIAPLLGSLLILSGTPKTIAEIRRLAPAELQAYRLQEAASVKLPYLGLALAILLLGVLIAKSNLWFKSNI